MSGGSNSVGAYQVGTWTFTGSITGAVSVTNWPASFGAAQDGPWTVTANQGTTPWTVGGTVTANQGTTPWAGNIRVVTTDAHSLYADAVYTDADKAFSVSISANQATGGADNPLLLLRNPLGSGKRLYLRAISYGIPVANVLGTVTLSLNPTVTVNGGALSIVNGNAGSVAASVALATSLPSVSASGSRVGAFVYGQNGNSLRPAINGRVVIGPGQSLLLSGNPGSNNRAAVIGAEWIEI